MVDGTPTSALLGLGRRGAANSGRLPPMKGWSRTRRVGSWLSILFAVVLSPRAALAQTTFVVDQEVLDVDLTGSVTTVAGDLAYGFVPQEPFLGGLRFEVSCCQGQPDSTVRIDVHEGSFGGPIVATSTRVLLDGPTTFGDGVFEADTWQFLPAPLVGPGTLYVAEFVIEAGGPIGFARVGNPYPAGSEFFDGVINAASVDFPFQSGRFAADPKLYWADSGLLTAESADLDGSSRMVVGQNAGAGALNGVSVDPVNAVVYWVECCGSLVSRIRRANLDSTNAVTIPVAGTFGFPQRVVVDPYHQYLFWSDSAASTGTIQRADTDGSGTTTLLGPGATPVALALDPVDEKLYWSETSGAVGIHRMNLDGSEQQALVTVALGDEIAQVEGLAIDHVQRKMYWTDLGRDEVRRANLDGSGIEVLASNASHGLQNPVGIDVDTVAEQLYWSDTTTDKITRANLDGSNPVDVLSSGLSFPRAIWVVDGGPLVLPPEALPALTGPAWPVLLASLLALGAARFHASRRSRRQPATGHESP